MRARCVFCVLCVSVVHCLTGPLAAGGLVERLGEAERRWDAAAAIGVLSQVRAAGEDGLELRVRAAAVTVGILRADFEATPENDRTARRALGGQIDVFAEEALGLIDRLPETAERERLRADLLGAQIRSDYRAQKHEPALTAAIARARELAPDDPDTLTLAATPLVLAPEGRGRDLDEAERLLRRALDRAPGGERARLLLARVAEQRGDAAAAAAAYRAVLAANPGCRPARSRLEALAAPPG